MTHPPPNPSNTPHNSDRTRVLLPLPALSFGQKTLFRSTLILATRSSSSSSPLLRPSINLQAEEERLHAYALSTLPSTLSLSRQRHTGRTQPPFERAFPPRTRARNPLLLPAFRSLGSCSHVKPNRSDTLYAREPPLSRLVGV